jgi:AbrB family looped-hinge helix DNA binding protein
MHGNLSHIMELLEESFMAKIDERGRIYLPKSVRKRLSLKPGDGVYIKISGEAFTVYTIKAIEKQLAEATRKL